VARSCQVCGKGFSIGNQVTIRGKAKYLGGVGTKITGITKRKFKPNGMMSFISEEQLRWKGDRLLLTMNFETEGSDGNGPEHVATASWNPSNGSVVLESIK